MKIDVAFQIAKEAHKGQVDKAGMPYIDHCRRVYMNCVDPTASIVALLHDVIEDTEVTLENLKSQGVPPDALEAIDCLTRRKGEEYSSYIGRIGLNQIAREVKIADLEDNMDVRRLPKLTGEDLIRLVKYHRAWVLLKVIHECDKV